MNTTNIITDIKDALNARNMLNIGESAELTRLGSKFDKKPLTDKEEAFVWKHLERLKAAAGAV